MLHSLQKTVRRWGGTFCLWIKSDPIARVSPQMIQLYSLSNLLCSCPHLLIFYLHNIYISLALILCLKSFHVWWIVQNHFKFFAEWSRVNNNTFILHMHRESCNRFIASFHWIYFNTRLLWFAWISSQFFYEVWPSKMILASMSSNNNFSSTLDIAKIYCVNWLGYQSHNASFFSRKQCHLFKYFKLYYVLKKLSWLCYTNQHNQFGYPISTFFVAKN